MAIKRTKANLNDTELVAAEVVTAASQFSYTDALDIEPKRKKTKDWFLTGVTDAHLVQSGASGYHYEATTRRVLSIGGERALELYCNGFRSIIRTAP